MCPSRRSADVGRGHRRRWLSPHRQRQGRGKRRRDGFDASPSVGSSAGIRRNSCLIVSAPPTTANVVASTTRTLETKGSRSPAEIPRSPKAAKTASPHARRRAPSRPAVKPTTRAITVVPMASAPLSAVPKRLMATSSSAGGDRSTTVRPTAASGDGMRRTRPAISSPRPIATAAPTTPKARRSRDRWCSSPQSSGHQTPPTLCRFPSDSESELENWWLTNRSWRRKRSMVPARLSGERATSPCRQPPISRILRLIGDHGPIPTRYPHTRVDHVEHEPVER